MAQAFQFETSATTHLPPGRCLRTQICLAVCMLASSVAHADGLDFSEEKLEHSVVATETVDYIKVANGISASIGGGGTLTYEKATEDFTLGGSGGSNTQLSMAGLASFAFDNAGQSFIVSGQGTTSGADSGTLILAADNLITTSHFGVGNVGRGDSSGNPTNKGSVKLGQNNSINADTITIGARNASGELSFQDDISDGHLLLRGTSGGDSRVHEWRIGTSDADATISTSSNVDLTGGTVDARVETLVIGAGISTRTTGLLTMAEGTLDANTIIIGQHSGIRGSEGILTVNGGTVLTRTMLIGDHDGGTGIVSGIVNLRDGATLRAQSIAAGEGTATRTINWSSGMIGNYAEDEDLTIIGVNIKLSDDGLHEFRIDGENARATVNAVLSDADSVGGTLLKTGTGMLILGGINTHSGTTTVRDGTLVINGALSNSDTIVDGGILAGSGSVNNVNVREGGAISNAMGTLTVNGNLTFDANSTYQFHADETLGDYYINVTGNTELDGKLDIRAGDGHFETDRHFTILTTAGEQSGKFAEVTTNLAFLTAEVSYGEHEVGLDLLRNDINYSSVAQTHNQLAVATALDTLGATPGGDSSTIIDAVTALSADQARASYVAIGGVGLAAVRRAAPTFATNFNNQLHARLASVTASSNNLRASRDAPLLLAANDRAADLQPASTQTRFSLGASNPPDAAGRGLWLRGYGSEQSTDADGNAAASRSKVGGFSTGFDTLVSPGIVIGGAVTHGRTITTAENEKGDANSNAVAFYTSYANGPWDVLASAGLTQHNISSERHIAFGSIDRTASASFKMYTVALTGEVSYAIPMAGWTLQPLTGLSVNYNTDKGFTETGADSLNLQVAGENRTAVQAQLGAKALLTTGSVQWQPRLIWAHEFGNTSAPMSAQLQESGAAFKLRGVAAPRDTLVTGLTVATQANQQVALFADVQGEFGSRQTNLSVLFGMRANW